MQRAIAAGTGCDGESSRVDYPACGLTIVSTPTDVGSNLRVFDSSGQLVGEELDADTQSFTCPTDPSFPFTEGALGLRAGRFPDGTCAAVACPEHYCGPCTADAGAPTDAGDASSCDCFIDPNVRVGTVLMSWDCFCQRYDCSERLPGDHACDNTRRDDYPACGLTVLTTGGIIGGPTIRVFDLASGNLVGEHVSSDVPEFSCSADPGFPTNGAFDVRAGRFPDTTCASVSCASGYCGPCPGP